MKYDYHEDFVLMYRRSRKGAWIEIMKGSLFRISWMVAPARERGLKLLYPQIIISVKGRSRKGAWIEI